MHSHRLNTVLGSGAVLWILCAASCYGQGFRDALADGQPCTICPELVVVPAGQFTMGSPANEPERFGREEQVQVSIDGALAVGRFAITFDEWDACVVDGGCNGFRPDDHGWGRGKRPVIGVNWQDAKAYVTWLSARTGKRYRLLSESEREFVARAGTTTPFWWGSTISAGQANYNGTYAYAAGSKGEYRQGTVPVDAFEPNPWGLYQVHGNVWEWTEDCWNDSNSGHPGNGSPRTSGDCGRHVVRGGSWYNIPAWLRAAHRYWYATDIRLPVVGFRVVRASNP
jgi:formylglycine-generating enzyme required for sulfatase activity